MGEDIEVTDEMCRARNVYVYIDGPRSNYPIAIQICEDETARSDITLSHARALRDWLSARITELEPTP